MATISRTLRFRYSNRRVGGIRFVRLGFLFFSFGVSR